VKVFGLWTQFYRGLAKSLFFNLDKLLNLKKEFYVPKINLHIIQEKYVHNSIKYQATLTPDSPSSPVLVYG